jgi:hypothetical protein
MKLRNRNSTIKLTNIEHMTSFTLERMSNLLALCMFVAIKQI